MMATPVRLMTASVSLLAVFFYFFTAFNVGRLRGKHQIKAPATSGHPEFERAYRVQLNTLEQLAIVLPLMWIGAIYPPPLAALVPLVGLIWVVTRVIYLVGYMAEPGKRAAGAGLGGLCDLALLVLAIWGVASAWLTTHEV
jgi:glutathione S-transferase